MAERFRAGFDGGSRGNPGPAAWGVVVLDADGRAVEGFAGAIGRATNNVAEYNGLLEALALAVSRKASDVELLADSELVVKQVRGEYKVRHPDLIPLHAEALRVIRGFARFKIGHVRRGKNKAADKLVNRALDAAEAGGDGGSVRLHEVFEESAAVDGDAGRSESSRP
jgi:ribonuclease HI